MIHIYCGDGKGKTTASIGLSVRMAGAGKKVVFGQFFKNGSSSEIAVLSAIPGIETLHCVTVPGLYSRLTEEQRETAKKDYTAYLHTLLEKGRDADLLVLDESISALNHGTIPLEPILDFLERYGREKEIVLTGRNPSQTLLQRADYVTEMVKRKHPFDRGIHARKGVEY